MSAQKIQVLKNITNRDSISLEHIKKLEEFSEFLLKWNQKINLVSKKVDAEELWLRHILDSAQLIKYLPKAPVYIVDFGSGAGFPGLIISIITGNKITLIESDQRKCAFMQEVIAKFNLDAKIITGRIEDTAPFPCDIITARALAPLEKLLSYSLPFLTKDNYMLLLKGVNVLEEIKDADLYWGYVNELYPAINNESSVLKISNVRRL